MTEKEALGIMKKNEMCDTEDCPPVGREECSYWVTDKECEEAYDAAKAALEKRIPKPYVMNIDTACCPDCGSPVERQSMVGTDVLMHRLFSYCENCGRAIEWKN